MAIDYNLGLRQDMLNRVVEANRTKDLANVAKYNREEKKKRQDKKGLMSAIANIALAVGTQGASIPYQAAYGGIANKALMGDDYEGSTMQGLQTLGSMAYKGAEAAKAKKINAMQNAHEMTINSIYKEIDSLPETHVQERARLSNIATEKTMDFLKAKKAEDSKPIWAWGDSAREQEQLKAGTDSGVSVKAEKSAISPIMPLGGGGERIFDDVLSKNMPPKKSDVSEFDGPYKKGLINYGGPTYTSPMEQTSPQPDTSTPMTHPERWPRRY